MFKNIKVKTGIAVAAALSLMGGTAAYAAHEFADVPTASGFHNSISFMKQRGITFGCNAGGTLYCPQDNVTRAQMAAFLERQARVLSTNNINAADSSGVSLPASTTTTACETGDYDLKTWSEWFHIDSMWSAIADATEPAPIEIRATIEFSNDAGASWIGLDQYHAEFINPGEEEGSSPTTARYNPDAPTGLTGTIRFRLALDNQGTLAATGYCNMNTAITHRYSNPTAGIASGSSTDNSFGAAASTR